MANCPRAFIRAIPCDQTVFQRVEVSAVRPKQLSEMRMIAISLAYPPLAYPRSIQVARLLKYAGIETALFCADEPDARADATIEEEPDKFLEYCERVPVRQSGLSRWIDRLSYRFYKAHWKKRNLTPDPYLGWKGDVLSSVGEFISTVEFRPDIIVSFAQPFTDHLIGMELKRRYGLPWLAHFSDPWVDNPFSPYDEQAKKHNLELERAVVEAADLLVFTSNETVDLVFSKYPDQLRDKARVLPQCFDGARFGNSGRGPGGEILIRYLGNFYGNRTAGPLISALERLCRLDAESIRNVRFELVGPGNAEEVGRLASGLPDGLVSARPGVGYQESLEMMSGADGLMVIDAPAKLSVFLPSKLIDYIGAGRPVLGITPPGAARSLIEELGGMVTDPDHPERAAESIRSFIRELSERRSRGLVDPWGDRTVRERYSAETIASGFRSLIEPLAAGPKNGSETS
ncbi:MAG: glycosyltransferase [Pyrinomonadaceae bacterium]